MGDFQKYLDNALKMVDFNDEITDETRDLEEINSLEINLGIEISKQRSKLGLSQSELSKKIGIQQSSLSKIEHGEVNPNLQTLKRIAKGLDKKLVIKLEDFYGEN